MSSDIKTIHIARSGELHVQLSLQEAQAFLDSGQLAPHDWAWFEGAPGWMALIQVPAIQPPQGEGEPPLQNQHLDQLPPESPASILNEIATLAEGQATRFLALFENCTAESEDDATRCASDFGAILNGAGELIRADCAEFADLLGEVGRWGSDPDSIQEEVFFDLD